MYEETATGELSRGCNWVVPADGVTECVTWTCSDYFMCGNEITVLKRGSSKKVNAQVWSLSISLWEVTLRIKHESKSEGEPEYSEEELREGGSVLGPSRFSLRHVAILLSLLTLSFHEERGQWTDTLQRGWELPLHTNPSIPRGGGDQE